MIHLERGPAPPDYMYRASAALQKLAAFFRREAEARSQESPPFDSAVWRPAKALLLERFHGKCAYCESPLVDSIHADVENYRPKSRYWWLAYDWDNLLVACHACNTAKANRFPLQDESARATEARDVESEEPLLLNPCQDRPEEHLVFGEDGNVYSDTARGQATIDTLVLNRPGLVAARRRVVAEVMAGLEVAKSSGSSQFLVGLVKDEAPYAATARQVLMRALRKARPQRTQQKWVLQIESQLREIAGVAEWTAKDVEATKSAYEVHEQAVETFALPTNENEEVSERYFAKRRMIERIQIRNFKAILRLDISLAGGPDETPSWLMLLGENATGKSSVLKAVALTLMDERGRRELGLHPFDLLSHGETEGHVRVWLTGVPEPMELTYRSGDETFGGSTAAKVLLLAYGCTRLLPSSVSNNVPPQGPVRAANLFNPSARLVDVEDWLGRLDPNLFGPAVRLLKELLPLGQKDRLETEDDPTSSGRRRVFVRMFGDDVSPGELSDGYQSVVALAADVLSVLLPVWKDRVDMAEGIVLIDEIDAHLHPTWRMRMVNTLRACFPHVQFITTTHDPLCLKGLRAGEVVVLRRTRRGRVTAVEDLPSPEGMSVDQLLTSEHFGLGSTVEPEVEKIFRSYYALLARKKRSAAQEEGLATLKAQLARLNHMGRTRREQLMLEIIDAYLAEDPPAGLRAQQARRRRVLEQLVARWTNRDTGRSPA